MVTTASCFIVMLGACTSIDSPPPNTSQEPQPSASVTLTADAGPIPDFTGPWASDLRAAYLKTANELTRRILEDGQISDAEMAEEDAQYSECLRNIGFTDIQIGQGGEMSVSPPADLLGEPDKVNDLVTECGESTGWNSVSSLQLYMAGNPDNIDSATIMAECLVRVGLKPEGYTSSQYIQEAESGSLEELYSAGTPEWNKWRACNIDPAHAK
jgi:hypothetical protein